MSPARLDAIAPQVLSHSPDGRGGGGAISPPEPGLGPQVALPGAVPTGQAVCADAGADAASRRAKPIVQEKLIRYKRTP